MSYRYDLEICKIIIKGSGLDVLTIREVGSGGVQECEKVIRKFKSRQKSPGSYLRISEKS